MKSLIIISYYQRSIRGQFVLSICVFIQSFGRFVSVSVVYSEITELLIKELQESTTIRYRLIPRVIIYETLLLVES